MPTRSSEDPPAQSLAELGLPGRAVTALARAGVLRTEQLAVLTRQDLAAIDGLGPGLIAAIRKVVAEPPAGRPRSVAPLRADEPRRAAGGGPGSEPAEEESPDAPPIPSFASLRAPERRTALDLLMPEPPAEPAAPGPVPPAGPRPAEYADLLALGVHIVRVAMAVPVRLVRWSVRAPAHSLQRLLGGGAPRPQR
jgi:hypothetical protein